jgi:hypothetical protein
LTVLVWCTKKNMATLIRSLFFVTFSSEKITFRRFLKPSFLSNSAESFSHRKKWTNPGTDVMILKIFSPNNSAKKLAFLTQHKAKLCKILIITLVFEKNAIFCQKWQKIVIITSTLGVRSSANCQLT